MKGQQFAINPTAAQIAILLKWIGHQRYIYNAKVQEDRYFRRFAAKSLQHTGRFAPVDGKYAHFRVLAPFLSEVPSQILRNGAGRFCDAYQRYFAGLGGRPKIKQRYGRQSVIITRELFQIVQNEHGNWFVLLGTKKHPVGAIKINAQSHQIDQANLPNSLCINVHGGQWQISFSNKEVDVNGDPVIYPDYTETLNYLSAFSLKELEQLTNGVDRGVAITACDAKQVIDQELLNKNKKKLTGKEKYRKRYQRKAQRQQKGSKRRARTLKRIANIDRYKRNCGKNIAHQISHRLTADDSTLVVAIEQLDVQRMAKRAKGKSVKAKSGLNRSIYGSNWGQLRAYLLYKTHRRGKLLVAVPAPYTSQECSQCRTINRASRRSQSLYACHVCGYEGNADHNASKVIARHAAWAVYQHLHSGQELSTSGKGAAPKPKTPVELVVSRETITSYHAQSGEAGNPTPERPSR